MANYHGYVKLNIWSHSTECYTNVTATSWSDVTGQWSTWLIMITGLCDRSVHDIHMNNLMFICKTGPRMFIGS